MAYDVEFAWETLSGSTAIREPDELEAWRAIIDGAESYPQAKFAPPLQGSKKPERPRKLGGLVWEYDRPEVLSSRITAVTLAAGDSCTRLAFGGDDDENAQALSALLLLPAVRGHMLAAWGAADAGFNAFLAQLARPLVRAGWSLEPIATGTRCKALVLRRGRVVLWLTDAQEMIGGGGLSESTFELEYAPRAVEAVGSAARLVAALESFQRQLQAMFKVALHATIGGAALRAAAQFISRKRALWRPSPLMVSMLRLARGYRGGYATATRYDGPGYRLDINKAYTAALATRLPLRSALVPQGAEFEGKPGVYLYRLHGPGVLPIYIGAWERKTRTFELQYWAGRRTYAVLESSEVPGIVALGYQVEQLGGFMYVRDWTLAPFARRIAELCARHGRGSAHERTAKIIGNSVYGKLAERPEREAVMYAEKRPGEDWHPMLDMQGDELPDLWTMRVVSHRPGQHVDVATHATATVRGWLYEAMALVIALGGEVVHADTDGIISTIDVSEYLDTNESQPGSWRAETEPRRAIVWGRKGYAYGDDVRVAGVAGITVHDAERIVAGETVETWYAARPAPWKSSAGLAKSRRRASATA